MFSKNNLLLFMELFAFGIIYTVLAYRGNGLTIGGDGVIPLHSFEYLTRLPRSSNPWAGFGSPLPPIFSLPSLPDTWFFFLFSFFDIYLANKLYVLVLSTLSVISIFYLGTTIFHGSAHKNMIGIVAACAYVFNPWILADSFKTMVFVELSLVQTGFILFLAFTIKYFRTKQYRYPFYSGLLSFLMLSLPGLSGYRMAFLAFLGYVFIAAYYLAHRVRNELSKALISIFKGAVIVVTMSLFLNSYWIIPFVQNANYFSSYASGFQPPSIFNEYSNMVNTLRLMNSWGFYSGYVPYAEIFIKNPLMIVLTFAWPVFAFAPLLSSNVVKNRKILAIYLATILTIFLAWGPESPFGGIYAAIVDVHLGQYYFLRPFYNSGTISSLILPLEYAVLIGLFSSLVYSWLIRKNEGFPLTRRRILPAFGAVLVVAILVSSSWPILTGDVMRNWYSPYQYGVRIPDSYWEANHYLEEINSLDHRVLLLPPAQTYVGTSWGYQGTSQFYNLMFNVPLITGNEVPYSIGSNTTLVNNVYSAYYRYPDSNNTLDIIKHTDRIITWQNDKTILANGSVRIDFNGAYQTDKWHQVEFELPLAEMWSNFTRMMIQFTAKLNLSDLQIGVGDTHGFVGWWAAQNYVYEPVNGTFFPTDLSDVITEENGSTTLILDLERPDLSHYSLNSVTSVWIQYFLNDNSTAEGMSVNKMLLANLSLNTEYYAKFLADYNIKYLIIDLSIKDGAKNDPKFWLYSLESSNYFKQIWHKDAIYIFENMIS